MLDQAFNQDLDSLRGKRVAVVAGPVSQEDRLYLNTVPHAEWSLTAVLEALTDSGVHCEHLDPTAADFIRRIVQFDAAFLNVHGPYGEDGRIQGLLDFLSVPYTSSGVLASSVGMDKLVSKAIFAHLGIATPRSSKLLSERNPFPACDFPLPAMLKAVDGGSSVGIRLIERADELATAFGDMADRGFNRCFLEEFIAGRALTMSAIPARGGLICLPPLEFVTTASAYYDESTKLGAEGVPTVQYRTPVDLPEQTTKEMARGAEEIHAFLDCRGAIRVDYMVDVDNIPYALEINTIPGLQRHSNLPVSCAEAGISYAGLVIRLLADTLSRATPAPWTLS